ncbi:MAG: anaerobic ribonucleoside-triphosphate reductase activating protein [Oscillospiraceae bacterium]|jgi:anaerobic ribonucleoside-triphosphate reductase activating protein|nr:anaerobic ribonucleoside-triphosphate reductase activating protein [Oscillospiraceae bacterium]
MNYCALRTCDVANGPGMRVTLFVSGCTNHCPGCFQPETWDFDYGQPFTAETQAHILDLLAPEYISGLTLLGGDPFEPSNQRALLPLLQAVKAQYPRKTVWAFTGFLLDEELQHDGSHPRCEVTDEMLTYIDILVDGRFIEAQKDVRLKFKGSANQRTIDVPKTLAQGKVVLAEI